MRAVCDDRRESDLRNSESTDKLDGEKKMGSGPLFIKWTDVLPKTPYRLVNRGQALLPGFPSITILILAYHSNCMGINFVSVYLPEWTTGQITAIAMMKKSTINLKEFMIALDLKLDAYCEYIFITTSAK